ncbi:hypothetical protein COOONC_02549 [Cooperia oncophora]
MDFSEIEKTIYGGNVEEDEELMAELLALQQEEEAKQRRNAPPPARPAPAMTVKPRGGAPLVELLFLPGVDPTLLSKALADDVEIDESTLENDPELLAELSGLIGGSEEEGPPIADATASAPLPRPPPSGTRDVALITKLRGLKDVYEKMLAASAKEGNAVKQRRHQRTVDRLKELIVKAERGESIDESEIPPAPPSFTPPSSEPTLPPRHAPPPPPHAMQPPPVPRRSTSGVIQGSSEAAPPPVPRRTSSSSLPPESPQKSADLRKEQVLKVLKRRRDAYVANGKAAVAAMDKTAAKQYVEVAKMFDQALAALDTASADELDLADVPPSPPPYRRVEKVEKPATFVDGLQSRLERFQALARKAAQEGNDRKARMNNRMAEQYAAAIRDAKAGRPVAVADLPSLPDMPPLPPQKPQGAVPKGPAPGMRPPPAVGPLAPSGQPGKSRNTTQLEFLLKRQNEFRHAAMQAKAQGNMELAKKYLLESKLSPIVVLVSIKMIAAAQPACLFQSNQLLFLLKQLPPKRPFNLESFLQRQVLQELKVPFPSTVYHHLCGSILHSHHYS